MKSYRPTVQQDVKHLQDYSDVLTQGDMNDYTTDSDILLQQDYLLKLKTQRQKIQQLWNLYQDNQKKLQRALQDNSKLSSENAKLLQMAQFKQKYQELKREFERVGQSSKRNQNQLQTVKLQLAQVIHQKSQIILNMKHQIKSTYHRHSNEKEQLQETLTDQQNYINDLKREYQDKQNNLKEQIQSLKNQIKSLAQSFDQSSKRYQDSNKTLYIQLQSKSKQVFQIHHNMISIEKENKRYKDQIMGLQDHVQRKEHEYKMSLDKLKRQIKAKNSQSKDKESSIKDLKSQINNLKNKISNLQKENQKTKSEIKILEQKYQIQINVVQDDFCRQRAHYQTTVMELRSSVDDLMDVKNQLILQNKKLMKIIKKKEEHEKIRKQLLKNQCKEIDRLQKIVDKVL